ncbi:MAG TPA: phytanoyl-CoA dioxygenase family protein [Chitinophagaceae bacterium]|nr:phytanoyl-CoA dioxygenase family protein [Chitinophagaceae bacterium]
MNNIELSNYTEIGRIGIMHLKRYWEKSMARREGRLSQQAYQEEWNLDFTLLSALGLGLEQTIKHLYLEKPGFDEFENWILELNGGSILHNRISEFNELVRGNNSNNNSEEVVNTVLDENDLEWWHNNGYVIIRDAVSREDCKATIEIISDFLEINLQDPLTWYRPHPARQGIMVQLFQHLQLEKNRRSEKIRRAYEQLWGRTDLWCNADRVSFNPPENEQWKFPGPRLHWDVSLELPIPFGLQGLLYLSDTQANQGAFTLVPGFQNKIESWIEGLPPGTDPRTQDLYQLGPVPIAANAGDFILWHQALPHASSPNTASLPRIVQYINYLPLDAGVKEKWK